MQAKCITSKTMMAPTPGPTTVKLTCSWTRRLARKDVQIIQVRVRTCCGDANLHGTSFPARKACASRHVLTGRHVATRPRFAKVKIDLLAVQDAAHGTRTRSHAACRATCAPLAHVEDATVIRRARLAGISLSKIAGTRSAFAVKLKTTRIPTSASAGVGSGRTGRHLLATSGAILIFLGLSPHILEII